MSKNALTVQDVRSLQKEVRGYRVEVDGTVTINRETLLDVLELAGGPTLVENVAQVLLRRCRGLDDVAVVLEIGPREITTRVVNTKLETAAEIVNTSPISEATAEGGAVLLRYLERTVDQMALMSGILPITSEPEPAAAEPR